MKLELKPIILFVLLTGNLCFAQSLISKAENSDVYSFISNLQVKGLIQQLDYNNLLTDTEIYKILNFVEINKISNLSKVEKEKLFYFKDKYFNYDKKKSLLSNNIIEGVSSWLNKEDEVFFQYQDSTFAIKFSPMISVGVKSAYNETQYNTTWGINTFGSIGNNIGFRMDFTENSIKAKNYEHKLTYQNSTGRIYSKHENDTFEFSETNGSLLFNNSYLTFGFTKEKFTMGQGKSGQLVLSSKTPSFPSVYLKLSPVNWLKFYYMHGWLISGVTDSGRIYQTELMPRKSEKEKYYAMHAIQIIPIPELSITLGETMIYSDRSFYMGYFIPFLFFRSVDHQFSFGSGDSGNNGSFFFEIAGSPYKGINSYFSTFIDEFSLTNLLKGKSDRNQLGYTIGSSFYPFIFDNLKLTAEYTKILPWVYSNWIPTQTYQNANYLMGHYIGQNADQIYVQIDYSLLHNLELSANFEYTRNGGFSNVVNQYKQPGESFLYGALRKETSIGFSASYEFYHELFAELDYKYTDITDEENLRTPDFMLGKNHSFSFVVYYGM